MTSSQRRERIVVGVDGSPASLLALGWASRQAALTDADLDVVHAWQVPSAYGMVPAGDDWEQRDRAELDRAVHDTLSAADSARVHVRQLRGHPAEALLEAAADADLLVVGSRGRGGFTGMMLGSVSQQLVVHAQCPVVVLHTK
ncbi:MAG TPA: universal stress protein [Pseudonocardia sp.]|jgi:nucleotide-binding universal stress UspA family protein